MKKFLLLAVFAVNVSSCASCYPIAIPARIPQVTLGIVDRTTGQRPTDATFHGPVAQLQFSWIFYEPDYVSIAARPERGPIHQISLYDPSNQNSALSNIVRRPGKYHFQLQAHEDNQIVWIHEFSAIEIAKEPEDRCAA